MIALINAAIYDYHQFYKNGYIIFDEKIIDVGPMNQYKEDDTYKVIDCHHHIILPGLVSGHTHLYSTLARGMDIAFNPENFLQILQQLWWKVDHFLDEKMLFSSALMGGLNQLKYGTTTLIDHHASHQVIGSLEIIYKALVKDLGMRSVLAFETSDRFSLEDAIKENQGFINQKHQDASGLFGMHASLSLSDQSLKKIANNIGDAGIHIHVAESQMDETRCIEQYGMRVVERLDHFGLINSKSLLVHCTHINEAEMDIIKKHEATIAINPTSNLNNAVGISNVKAFLDKGIRVIIGNDGLIPSQPFEYLNTYYLGHLKTASPTGLSLNDIKQLIINTYQYTNELLNTHLGHFIKGAEADIIVHPYQPFTPMSDNNVFGHLFYGVFPGFKPASVFIKGKHIIKDYRYHKDMDDAYDEAIKQTKKLWKKIEKEGDHLEFKNAF